MLAGHSVVSRMGRRSCSRQTCWRKADSSVLCHSALDNRGARLKLDWYFFFCLLLYSGRPDVHLTLPTIWCFLQKKTCILRNVKVLPDSQIFGWAHQIDVVHEPLPCSFSPVGLNTSDAAWSSTPVLDGKEGSIVQSDLCSPRRKHTSQEAWPYEFYMTCLQI